MFRKLLLITFLLIGLNASAQPQSMRTKAHPYRWMFGLSWSVLDDNGEKFTKLFDFPTSYNFEYFPSRFFVDRYFNYGWSMEGALTFNRFDAKRQVNDTTGVTGFLANLDVNAKFSFNRYFRNAKWFDPYVSMGIGGTFRTDSTAGPFTPNVNIGLGMNFWFGQKRHWGIQLQTCGKLAVWEGIPNNKANYIQYSIGAVYRFTPKKSSRSNFDKRRNKWINKKQKYNRGRNS
ncbi:MAG: hypothetical protein V4638_12020 [Bacteroidota bacterium]